MDPENYAGREQTLVKHFILQKYLERFAHIVGSRWDVLTYVDCFSGPWNVRSDSLEDSSFAIALNELRKARDTHRQFGREIRLRCFFLEKEPAAYQRLKAFADAVTDAQVETRNATLEDSVQDIVAFVGRGGRNSFPFVFIDPTGWTGFEMDVIRPLLRLDPGEVLINFMTGHIRRFLELADEHNADAFRRLFGADDIREKVRGTSGKDREDVAIEEYSRAIQAAGSFRFTCSAIVLHPEFNRTQFHLLYATRSQKGVEVFKDAEKRAMAVQEDARAEAQKREREARTRQRSFLTSEELYDPTHYDALRERYLSKSRRLLLDELRKLGRVPYDDAWILALSQPMTWESDLKEWIREWRSEGRVDVEGMKERQRVPQRDAGNVLVWK